MSRKPCIEMHLEDMGAVELVLSGGTNERRFSIGRAQCNSAVYCHLIVSSEWIGNQWVS
jgi:hypothetical protein